MSAPAMPIRSAALALVLALVPAAPRAQETLGVLAVAEPPGPGAELAALAGQLRAALAVRSASVLGGTALRERMTSRGPPPALTELDRAYAGALAAHASGEFEAANRTLRAVVEALDALPESPAVFAAWTRAMVRLARSEQELGRGLEAQAVLERVVRAAPDVRADARQYPPSFQNLVEEARARVRALGTRRLTVESQPEARVFVEGREVGTSPVTVDLAPGRYRVAGLRGGIAAPALVVDLQEDRIVQLDLSLADALRPEAGPGLALAAPDRSLRILTASARLGLDRAVAATLSAKGGAAELVATVYDVRRGTAEREGRLRLAGGAPPPAGLDALAAYLLNGEPSPLVLGSAGPTLGAQLGPADAVVLAAPAAAPRAHRTSALGWTAVGTGVLTVVAGSLAVVYAREAQAQYGDARAMLDPTGRVALPNTVAAYNTAVRTGDDRRATATGLAVTAGVGAVTTAVLGYLSYRQTGEIGPLRF